MAWFRYKNKDFYAHWDDAHLIEAGFFNGYPFEITIQANLFIEAFVISQGKCLKLFRKYPYVCDVIPEVLAEAKKTIRRDILLNRIR